MCARNNFFFNEEKRKTSFSSSFSLSLSLTRHADQKSLNDFFTTDKGFSLWHSLRLRLMLASRLSIYIDFIAVWFRLHQQRERERARNEINFLSASLWPVCVLCCSPLLFSPLFISFERSLEVNLLCVLCLEQSLLFILLSQLNSHGSPLAVH